jgi:hypothetical protein
MDKIGLLKDTFVIDDSCHKNVRAEKKFFFVLTFALLLSSMFLSAGLKNVLNLRNTTEFD